MGYNINVMQQTACLVVNPITVGNFAFLFNWTPLGRTSDLLVRGDRDSRANLMPIYDDLYQIKLEGDN